MDKMTDERFQELRSTITIKGTPLEDAPIDDVYAEWEGGMYLDSAAGLTDEQEERLTVVERELSNRQAERIEK